MGGRSTALAPVESSGHPFIPYRMVVLGGATGVGLDMTGVISDVWTVVLTPPSPLSGPDADPALTFTALPGNTFGFLGSTLASSFDPTLVYSFFGLTADTDGGASLVLSSQPAYAYLGCRPGSASPDFLSQPCVDCPLGKYSSRAASTACVQWCVGIPFKLYRCVL